MHLMDASSVISLYDFSGLEWELGLLKNAKPFWNPGGEKAKMEEISGAITVTGWCKNDTIIANVSFL